MIDKSCSVPCEKQVAKRQLKDAFIRAQLGNWVKKPIEQDMFEVDIWLVRDNDPRIGTKSRIPECVVPSAN